MNINILTPKDDNWTNALNNIQPSVNKLFYRGELPSGPRLGVIGSRRPTAYGSRVTEQLVTAAAREGVVIVSGMALGIDSLAHRAALDVGGSTVAVLPSAVQTPYPTRHGRLAEEIERSGAVISEYRSPQPIHASHFIARNRIIAALSDVLLVIEASYKSGTMHTVNFALKLGHEVAAVPGHIDSVLSQGTNSIIRDGAHLITSTDDILQLLGVDSTQNRTQSTLSSAEKSILNTLENEPLSIDEITKKSRLESSELSLALTQLELNNMVAKGSDGMYSRRC